MRSHINKTLILLTQTIALWLPIIFLFVFSYGAIGKKALLCYVLLASIIYILGSLIRLRSIRLVFSMLSMILFACLSYVDIIHSLMFNDMLSPSTIYIILETNTSESREFLAAGFDHRYVYIGVVLVASLILNLFTLLRYDHFFSLFRDKSFMRIPILLFPLFLSSFILWFLSPSFLPVVAVRSVKQYHIEKEVLNNLASDKLGGEFTNVEHFSEDDDEIYILIIGESTTRQHMGLYGYERDNNPLLSELADELIIYENVISPHTHTISALSKVLTNASFDEGKHENTGSLIQLFNKAGFETYWLSNQCPIGAFESTVTALSNSCDRQIFINAKQNNLDEGLLFPLQSLLQEKVDKKLIIMHLMGTHVRYDKRYSKDFNIYHTQPETQFKHEKAYNSINTYDNAVLYNDYIVSEIMNQLKLCNVDKSCALYLSDHGEEVFKDKNFALHAEYDDTKAMYDIPFILWMSESMESDSSRFVLDESRKYSSEDLIFTMADIAGIHYIEFDETKSLVNPNFLEKSRLITDMKLYDEVFSDD